MSIASPQRPVTYERVLSSLTLDQLRAVLYARLGRPSPARLPFAVARSHEGQYLRFWSKE
jgi:hypothetical protein